MASCCPDRLLWTKLLNEKSYNLFGLTSFIILHVKCLQIRTLTLYSQTIVFFSSSAFNTSFWLYCMSTCYSVHVLISGATSIRCLQCITVCSHLLHSFKHQLTSSLRSRSVVLDLHWNTCSHK